MTELTNNLKDLETIVQRKQQNARTIEDGVFSFLILATKRVKLMCMTTSTKAKDHG